MNVCLQIYRKTEYRVFKLNHIILYFLLIFGDKELHHRVLMLHINDFDMILNNKELKYIYIFHLQERGLKFSCKGGEKKLSLPDISSMFPV